MTEPSVIQKQIDRLGPWFHNIHMPDGSQTAPDHFLGDFPGFKWDELKTDLPGDLTGKTVLDVGCNAGFYSLKFAQLGADVTAVDLDTNYLRQAEWVIGQFGLTDIIRLEQKQVYDLAKEEKTYDIVVFMGLFYHLRYPLLALDILSKKTKRLMIFQTLTMPGDGKEEPADDYSLHDRGQLLENGWPKMGFIEKKFNSDPTNWWFANSSCIEAMLRTCGFKITGKPGNELFLAEPDPERPGVTDTWDESEYLSAVGREWQHAYQRKIK